jgi:hypothetical protein
MSLSSLLLEKFATVANFINFVTFTSTTTISHRLSTKAKSNYSLWWSVDLTYLNIILSLRVLLDSYKALALTLVNHYFLWITHAFLSVSITGKIDDS